MNKIICTMILFCGLIWSCDTLKGEDGEPVEPWIEENCHKFCKTRQSKPSNVALVALPDGSWKWLCVCRNGDASPFKIKIIPRE